MSEVQQVLDVARREIAGTPFHFVEGMKVLDVILKWRESGRREMIIVNNPNAVMLCHQDKQMMEATCQAGLVLPDGVGVVLAGMILGYGRRHRVTGPWLTLKICNHGRKHGLRHYFYGGAEGVADRMAARLQKRFPGMIVAGTYCPPFRPLTPGEDAEMVAQINRATPDIVWVGLGAPKQEKWMLEHHRRLDACALIGVGAAFDFHSGNVRWAPKWVRKCGCEWIYRLLENPARMWRRNLNTPKFLFRVIKQATPRFGFTVPLPMSRKVTQKVSPKPIPILPSQRPLYDWCSTLQSIQESHEASLPPPRFSVQEVLRRRTPAITPIPGEFDPPRSKSGSVVQLTSVSIEPAKSKVEI